MLRHITQEEKKMIKKKTELLFAVLALAGMTQAFATGPVFHPDFTETGEEPHPLAHNRSGRLAKRRMAKS